MTTQEFDAPEEPYVPGYPHVFPDDENTKAVLELFKQKPKWIIDDMVKTMGAVNGRRIYAAVFALRHTFLIPIKRFYDKPTQRWGYVANLPEANVT